MPKKSPTEVRALLNYKKSMGLDITAASSGLTLEDIIQELKEIKENQRQNTVEFNKSYDLIYEKIDDANKAVDMQNKKLDDFLGRLEKVITENRQLRHKVEDLQSRVEELEQYSRKNCVELQGVPVTQNEDVMEVLKKVASKVDFSLEDTMIDNCHRLGKQLPNGKPPGIIVKFVRNMDKEEFLRKKRAKRGLTAKDLGFSADDKVYINESLSPARRRLLALAKEAKQSKNYKFVWVRGGKIFMKKDEHGVSPTFVIMKNEDLTKL